MIKGILFDKDGTLIDFHSLWISAAVWSVSEITRLNNLHSDFNEYILETIGVKDGKIKPNGALAYKVYDEIAEDICNDLSARNVQIDAKNMSKQLVFFFEQFIVSNKSKYTEITDTKKLVEELKDMGIFIGMSTADTKGSAIDCLEKLGVIDEFDYIGADDGVLRAKPAPDMVFDFMHEYSLKAEEIMIVGDTYNDILFAKRSGAKAVGVLSGVSQAEDFKNDADFILSSVADIPNLIKKECINYGRN